MKDFDTYFAELANLVATKSKDRSTRVGCVIVGPHNEIRSTGYNGFPRGVDDDADERHDRPEKYLWTIHAEVNALLNAARCGIGIDGCRLYVSQLFPCSNCAGAMIQAGIIEVIATPPNFTLPKWGEEFARSVKMFDEAGVKIRYLTPAIDTA